MDDGFWESLVKGHTETKVAGAIDNHLRTGSKFETVRTLTDKSREEGALPLPVTAGTRVSFTGSLGAVLSEENVPTKGLEGEVVFVRSASFGDVTSHEGRVFVKWDDGEFRPIQATYLRAVESKPKKMAMRYGDPTTISGGIPRDVTLFRVASLGALDSFLRVAESTLIHKSTKDLWSFTKEGDGTLLVERLFDSDGKPLKG